MTKSILIILTLAGFVSGAEFEVTDKLSVVSTAVFSGNVGIGTGAVGGARLAVGASTDTAYLITAGTGAAYSLSLSTSGNLQVNGTINRGTYTVLDSSMLDSFTLKLDTTTNKIKLADRIEQNIMLDAFKIAVSSSLSIFNMVDGIMDEFEDESGVDTVGSSSQTYNSAGHYYSPLVDMGGIDSNTKLMLHFNSAINGSKEIQDSGNTGHIVTQVGTAALTTAQKKIGNCSLALNGSSDYVTVPDNPDWDLGTGDFTIDCWVYFKGLTGSERYIISHGGRAGDTPNTAGWTLEVECGLGRIRFINYSDGSSVTIDVKSNASSVTTNAWYHVAVVRSGIVFKMFINGRQSGTTVTDSDTISTSSSLLRVGVPYDFYSGTFLDGYIDELRVSKGIARWTSDFDIALPTSPYISDSSTKLLLHMESLDVSSATPKIPAFVGTAHLDTAQKEFGTTSLYLNGSSDYVSIPGSDDWDFGTGDFTIDLWAKFNADAAETLFDFDRVGFKGVSLNWDTGDNVFYLWLNGTTSYMPGFAWTYDTDWNHFAIARSGTNLRFFINGILQGAARSDSTNITSGGLALTIGKYITGGNQWFNGYIDEFRVSKGIARWTTNFTRPTIEYSTTTPAVYNMTLVSTTTIAVSTPSSARIVLFEEDVDTATLNSELQAYVTGKDTTSWTQVTLADEGYYQSGRRILSGMASIAAASTGTAMRWKVETHNSRKINLHGVGLNWD